MTLKGRRVLVGISGGIAAYKIPELVRCLQRRGAEVRCVATEKAARLVSVDALATLTHAPVETSVWETGGARHTHHIDWAQWAELFVIAPLTANTAARLAHGLAEDSVSLAWLSCQCPKLLCPAMNTRMLTAPATRRNLAQLALDGAFVLAPDSGELACGETGEGRMPDPERIAQEVETILSPKASRPLRLLLTMGRTEEPIGAVRVITNHSSGRTGAEIAQAALRRGHQVTVVCGPCDIAPPPGVKVVRIRTALEMQAAVEAHWPGMDAAICAAAVADFRPAHPPTEKIPASRGMTSIELLPNPDILAGLCANRKPGQKVVGFALGTGGLERGQEKLGKKGADLCVCNDPLKDGADAGFGRSRVWGWIGTPAETIEAAWIPKSDLAGKLLQRLESLS
jgi:phosphopantothenoylcysteine decarboxylase / phosphopantothenate---cysteine ligase